MNSLVVSFRGCCRASNLLALACLMWFKASTTSSFGIRQLYGQALFWKTRVAHQSFKNENCCSPALLTAVHKGYVLSPLFGSYDDNDKGLNLKNLAILSLGVIGVFGLGFVSTVSDVIKTSVVESSVSQPKLKTTKVADSSSRGSLTKLTRREINQKLSQIPIFFITADEGKSIWTADDLSGNPPKGFIFTELEDANSYKEQVDKSGTLKVSASTLNDVFYTLVEKSTKLGAFVEGVASGSNALATYSLIPSPSQVAATGDQWKSTHDVTRDIPLFRISNLAFTNREGTLEFPLFLRREDAESSYKRLQESKPLEARDSTTPVVQETSLYDMIALFSTGGFEARSLEFYPSMSAIERATEIILNKDSTLPRVSFPPVAN